MALEDCVKSCLAQAGGLPPRPPVAYMVQLSAGLARIGLDRPFLDWMESARLDPSDGSDLLLAIAIANRFGVGSDDTPSSPSLQR